MSTRGWLWAASVAFACAKDRPLDPASWSELPVLPSPSAGTYARAPGTPPDRPLAALLAGRRWDASLAGAAAGIAMLRNPNVPPWHVRHLVWRAGYPYPVETLSIWRTNAGDPPPQDLIAWIERQPATADLGVVRSRDVNGGETWVALAGQSRANIGVQPKQLPTGATFTLPAIDGATVTVADSRGHVSQGNLAIPQTFTADLPGEWLVRVADADGTLARFPIYVGVTPPQQPVVDNGVSGTPEQQARATLDDVRATHGLAPYTSDLLFEAAAKRDLDGSDTSREQLAGRLGWPSERFARWDVRAPSVAEAIDRMIWEPSARPALLADAASYGLAAADDGAGVRVVVLVGFE